MKSRMTSGFPTRQFQPERMATRHDRETGTNKQWYNEDKPLILGHRLSLSLGTSIMKIDHISLTPLIVFTGDNAETVENEKNVKVGDNQELM